MADQLRIIINGWPKTRESIRPGLFVWRDSDGQFHVGFKSEYMTPDGRSEAFNEAGEAFCAPADEELWPVEVVREDGADG